MHISNMEYQHLKDDVSSYATQISYLIEQINDMYSLIDELKKSVDIIFQGKMEEYNDVHMRLADIEHILCRKFNNSSK